MSARLRSRLAILAVGLAGVASLATSQAAYPGLADVATDTTVFVAGERTAVRHVVIRVVSGSVAAEVSAGLSLVPPTEHLHRENITVTVRAGDGASIGERDPYETDRYSFDLPDCPATGTCTAAFTVTFARGEPDLSNAEEVEWSVDASAGYRDAQAVPDGASLSVEITD